MKKQWLFVFVLSVLFVSSYGFAGQEAPSRPATKADLVGTWKMISVRPNLDSKDPVFYPFQKYVFRSDSSMKYITSDKDFTKDWLDKFEKQATEIDYTVNEKGLLTLSWQKQAHQELAIAAYVQKDMPESMISKLPKALREGAPKKGNLTLSFLNSSGKIAYQKVFQKVSA